MSKKIVLFTCIVTVLGTVTATAAFAGTETIILPEHTCRARRSVPDDNQSSSVLVVRANPGEPSRNYKSWLKFDISELDVASIEAATLTLTLSGHDRGPFQFDISYVNDDCLDNIDWTT